MTNFDYLFALIDEPLEPTPYKQILAYLAARDIMGADLSALANQLCRRAASAASAYSYRQLRSL